MIRKNWNFCDQIFEAVAISDKNLKIFIFMFFQFQFFFFFQNIFHFNIPLVKFIRFFKTIEEVSKISAVNKKLYFSYCTIASNNTDKHFTRFSYFAVISLA